jgi:hypothetical protein
MVAEAAVLIDAENLAAHLFEISVRSRQTSRPVEFYTILKAPVLTVVMCPRFRPGGPSTEPTSEFIAACPCPDGLAQDGTQGGNAACIISHRGCS